MMKDNENITIVIATHNDAVTIKRAMDAATRGVRPANQVIVGDNDSTDDTYRVLCELLGAECVTIDGVVGLPPKFDGRLNDVPVKIFRKRLSTIGDTLNLAMQMQWQGVTIFGFADPKSWYAPDKISQAIRVFRSQPSVACVVSDWDDHHPDGRVERVFSRAFDMQRLLLDFPYDRNFLVQSQVFPKLKSGFNAQLQTMEDYELMLRVAEMGLIYHIPAPLHNNIVSEIDASSKKIMLQCEDTARQLAAQRRG